MIFRKNALSRTDLIVNHSNTRMELAEQEARSLCSIDFIKELKNIQPIQTVFVTFVLWIQLFGAWMIALLGPPIFYIPALVIICSCISAMQLWVHESSHFNLFQNRKFNDIWAMLFFSGPIGVSINTYRRFHMTHHANLAKPNDMDRFAFNVDVRGDRKLIYLFLRCLFCLEGVRIATRKYLAPNSAELRTHCDLSLAISAGWNILLLMTCVIADKWYLYFLLWIYPIFGIAVLVNSIRSIAEHQPVGFIGPASSYENIDQISRTTLPSFWEKWLMFQANFNYHYEHHLYPTVPASNLPKLHLKLVKKGFYNKYPELLQMSALTKVLRLSSGISKAKNVE